ncbi:MAG: histidine phosphatase family protein [Candidatus Paceibacterota bacterium]|nr:histidine phosphatase family protein [Candidatus Paceibacterota bacterium]
MNPQYTVLKRFYFVRHGQTVHNVNNEYQDGKDPLTEKGMEQASLVAERFVSIPADRIIASDYQRTQQTAHAISEKTGLEITSSELFRELRRPTDLVGKKRFIPESKLIMDEMIEHEPIPDWHHLDEENLFEAVARARKALDYLCSVKEETVIVVTHELFIKIMLSAMAVEDDAKAVEFYRTMRYFMVGDNTGITIAEYGNFINDIRFRLRIWNDHAHL